MDKTRQDEDTQEYPIAGNNYSGPPPCNRVQEGELRLKERSGGKKEEMWSQVLGFGTLKKIDSSKF